MNNLAQYLAYSQPQTGQSKVSPIAMSLMSRNVDSPWEAAGNIALIAADALSRKSGQKAQAKSVAELLAGPAMTDPSLNMASQAASAGGGGYSGPRGVSQPQGNANYDQIYNLLIDNPNLAPIFQAQALEKQYPDIFSEPEDLQPVWDETQGRMVYGTPQAGQPVEGPGSWQNLGNGQLMRVGPGGGPEFMAVPGWRGSGGGGAKPPNTTGLPKGQMWGRDSQGNWVAVQIPGYEPGSEGPEGKSADERYWSTLRDADPSSPEYAAAYFELFQRPKTAVTQDGVVSFTQPAPDWVTPPAGQEAASGSEGTLIAGTKKGATGESAGRVAAMKVASSSLDEAEALLFPGGEYDPGVAFSADMPLVGGPAPYSPQGQQAYTAVYQAVDAWLRASTGAAAPDSEIRRYTDAYMPGPFDDPQAARYKLNKLRQLIDTVNTEMSPHSAAPEAPQADPLGMFE